MRAYQFSEAIKTRKRIAYYDSDSQNSEADNDYESKADVFEQPLKKSLKLELQDDEDYEEDKSDVAVFSQLMWREKMDNLVHMMETVMETHVVKVKKQKTDKEDIAAINSHMPLFYDDELPDINEDEDDDHGGGGDGDIPKAYQSGPIPQLDAEGIGVDSEEDEDVGYFPDSPEPEILILPPESPKPIEIVDLDDYDEMVVFETPEPEAHPPTPPPTPKTQQLPRWSFIPFLKLKREPGEDNVSLNDKRAVDVVDLCDTTDDEAEMPRAPLRPLGLGPVLPVEDVTVISSSEDEDVGPETRSPPSPEGGMEPMEVVKPCPLPPEEEEIEEDGPKLVKLMNPWMRTRLKTRLGLAVTEFSATESQLIRTAFEYDSTLQLAASMVTTMTTQSHRPLKWVKLKFLGLLRDSTCRDHTRTCYSVLRHILRYHSFCRNSELWSHLSSSVQRVKAELKCEVPSSESFGANVLCISLITQSVESNLQCRVSDRHFEKSATLMAEFFSSKCETLVDWLQWCVVEKWTGYRSEKIRTLKCFQLLIALPLLVCNEPLGHTTNLARSLRQVYITLPCLEDRAVLLSTVASPLLRAQLLANVLDCEARSSDSMPKVLTDRYSSRPALSLDKIVRYYFLVPPPLHRLRAAGHELAMVLNMLLDAYITCREEKYVRDVDGDGRLLEQLQYHIRELKERLIVRNGRLRLSDSTMFLLNSIGHRTQ